MLGDPFHSYMAKLYAEQDGVSKRTQTAITLSNEKLFEM